MDRQRVARSLVALAYQLVHVTPEPVMPPVRVEEPEPRADNVLRRNVRCAECGCRMPVYMGPPGRFLCWECGNNAVERCPSGATVKAPTANWENDASGASGTWDAIVRAYEECV